MLLLALALLATPDFPGVLQQQFGLPNTPRCTVCHATDAGGSGTATRPFGVYLRSRGLQAGDDDSLRNALLADIGENHSSNGGQTTDVVALKAGDDPNGDSGPTPAYGCSSNSAAPSVFMLLLLVAWSAVRNRFARAAS